MSEVSIELVESALDGPVSVSPERRGFAKRRGVPDSVFWIAPASDILQCQPLPVLVELEGGFASAADDFSKFAARHEDEDYQYFLEWPIVSTTGRDPFVRTAEYDVTGIRANQLADQRSISEAEMHSAFSDWFDHFAPDFQTTTNVRRYGETTVVIWQLDFTIYGHDVSPSVPFIVEIGDNLTRVLERRISAPTIPSVVVVNDKYDSRDHGTYFHETTIEVPPIRPVRFR